MYVCMYVCMCIYIYIDRYKYGGKSGREREGMLSRFCKLHREQPPCT